MTDMDRIVRGYVLLTMGEWEGRPMEAHVSIPDRDHRNPVRVPAHEIADALGVETSELPGQKIEVTMSGTPDNPVLYGWRALE